MVGKRKRETVVATRQTLNTEHVILQPTERSQTDDVFRKYFEATFDPLLDSNAPARETEWDELTEEEEEQEQEQEQEDENSRGDVSDQDADSVASSWSGISRDEAQAPEVQVVEHDTTTARSADNDSIDRIFQKSFMSSRPPRGIDDAASKTQTRRVKNDDDEDESANLRRDLDLQRLLQESHLLEQSKRKATPGTHRHKATDMRLQSLGSKGSIFTQQKMPMSHRKGIIAKASSKDALRRREARDNGVILEKPTSKKRHDRDTSRRDRGVDVPAVGKFRGGTLQLSRKDVASIQGPRRTGTNTKRNGRR